MSLLGAYEVKILGIEDPDLFHLVSSASSLVDLQSDEPATQAALERRVKQDIPNFLKALHSRAYYNARISWEIEDRASPKLVVIKIIPGVIYPLSDFKIEADSEESEACLTFAKIKFKHLGISLGEPAAPKMIVKAQEALLRRLAKKGFPLATIEQCEVLADQREKSVRVVIRLHSGPLCFFGPTYTEGNCQVQQEYFFRKMAWVEGDVYDPRKIEKTFNSMEASGVFSTLLIHHADEAEEGFLPIHIQVTEGKMRSVGAGISYATDFGLGVSGEWEHRNIRGLGERMRSKANLWQRKKEANFFYIKPDFCCIDQDLIFHVELEHEKTKGFVESYLSVSETLERRISNRLRVSYGMMFKELHNSHSNNNRVFTLLKIPLQMFWSKTNNLLDPTKGQSFHFKSTPSFQLLRPQFAYVINQAIATGYIPIDCDHNSVLAIKAVIGSICGTNSNTIPPSERFYAGSDNLLRGYKYMTVGPLDKDRDPIGGRSLLVFSLEFRKRINDTLGFVVFFDAGNVYQLIWPDFSAKLRQSTGIGIRYHTPVGPLRLDLAFPLNRRSHIDNKYQIYMSIGQAF